MSLSRLRIASVLLLASLAFAPAMAITTPATASDDDIICFDYPMPGGGSETECGTRGDYKAECKLVDPDNTTDFCQDVNSASIRLNHAALIAASQDDGSSVEVQLPQPKGTRR
ncbi:MAG: hypothetical protein ABIY37_16145 [Devosia sp.]